MSKLLVKSFLLLFAWFLIFLCINFKEEEKEVEKKEEERKEYYVEVSTQKETLNIELEEYLIGVVVSEMPYTFEKEALKAQCVAARTFVLQRGLKVDDTTASQVYKSEVQLKEIYDEKYEEMIKKVKEVVKECNGEILTYQKEAISALFYSCSNGFTNDASWYYQYEKPYLKSVDSHWDTKVEAYEKVIELSKVEICEKLQIPFFKVVEEERYENNYVKQINIGGISFTGREVREKLGLRSSCFRFEEINGNVFVYTQGYGHGVGMSQYGANEMAKEGKSYIEILKHYYTGVEIENID